MIAKKTSLLVVLVIVLLVPLSFNQDAVWKYSSDGYLLSLSWLSESWDSIKILILHPKDSMMLIQHGVTEEDKALVKSIVYEDLITSINDYSVPENQTKIFLLEETNNINYLEKALKKIQSNTGIASTYRIDYGTNNLVIDKYGNNIDRLTGNPVTVLSADVNKQSYGSISVSAAWWKSHIGAEGFVYVLQYDGTKWVIKSKKRMWIQ